MSLRLRRIALDDFRKFREPFAIDGLTDGLNIVIEPNETGKSTLLDALRAAFFVRHGTRNRLAQSFAPHGELVAPSIDVTFEVAGERWAVAKRFLKGASIEVDGPQGKAQGEDAEARLHALLGSVRDTSQGGDPACYGALGLLWVAQMDALSVVGPGQIVRDTVRSTLEAEVGAIMGGPAYQRVRDRIEAQYGVYWTPTGQKRGRQTEAKERLEAAEAVARDAADRLASLERSFAELEAARTRAKVLARDLADETDAQARRDLVVALDIARGAAQILATRRAEQEAAGGRVRALEDLQRRYDDAIAARDAATLALAMARDRRIALDASLASARQGVVAAKAAREAARTARQDAARALAAGEAQRQMRQRLESIVAARRRHAVLLDHERDHRAARALADTLIPAATLTALEAAERAVAQAQAAVQAGATRIAFAGPAENITIDGAPIMPGERTLTRETRIRFGDAELVVIPPVASEVAEETLAAALSRQARLLADLGVDDLAAARARNDAARDAAADLRTLLAQIQAATPADAVIELAAGPDALKLFVAGLGDDIDANEDVLPDITALTAAMAATDTALARAEGALEAAVETLRRTEADYAPLTAAEAGATSDLSHATTLVHGVESKAEFASLAADLTQARERAAEAAVALTDALRDATAHDAAAIARKIETIDARARTAGEARTRLEMEIARLEATIESEGGKGLADHEAAAREEVEAACEALRRITEEADTLKLLRDTLEEARTVTSARFVGPVARRARRHIERLLPDCELTFSDDLMLEKVIRGGVVETCAHLSRGTQEQLAVLTRIAFADMLLEQGHPVSLILDDPLVYSDDARLDVMIDILTETATRMQVILLTCRDRAFRHVPGHRINLVATGAATAD